MWYKNIAGRFFGLVTKHTCDRQTDRITTPKTALAQRRALKPSLGFNEARGDEVAMASARPYANYLHLAPDR